jgi:N-acetylmuramoyl-L-alanine amidase
MCSVYKKKLICFIFIIILVGLIINVNGGNNGTNVYSALNTNNFTIVIDAGHGGKDKGSISLNSDVHESDLNLQFSKVLENYFNKMGYNVVQTRKTKASLNKNANKFIKLEDMNARKKVIEEATPDMVISIHMNEYKKDPTQSGAQVFYHPNSEESKKLSNYIQKSLNKKTNKQKLNLSADFYLLRNTSIPSVVVECGFLSNPTEEKLLKTKKYQEELCYSIFAGAVEYFLNLSN